jgi:hypothetical protein
MEETSYINRLKTRRRQNARYKVDNPPGFPSIQDQTYASNDVTARFDIVPPFTKKERKDDTLLLAIYTFQERFPDDGW